MSTADERGSTRISSDQPQFHHGDTHPSKPKSGLLGTPARRHGENQSGEPSRVRASPPHTGDNFPCRAPLSNEGTVASSSLDLLFSVSLRLRGETWFPIRAHPRQSAVTLLLSPRLRVSVVSWVLSRKEC